MSVSEAKNVSVRCLEVAVSTKGYIVLTFKFQKEGKKWVASCEELGTSTYGRSLPEAEQRLLEAVSLHLSTLEDVGEKERFFKEHSIKFHQVKPRNIKLSVPVDDGVFISSCLQKVTA
jgi:predicted RNase H-like HicB family nuclease